MLQADTNHNGFDAETLAALRHANYAHTNHDGTVIFTKPTMRWPFITSPSAPTVKDRSASWLKGAMLGLGLLAIAAATVSIRAQYLMVHAARHELVVSAIEAAIPDVAALIFACLGIALALRGKRAFRARLLNAGAVATSVFMNFAAAGHGWRSVAIWLMPPVAYALASDTCIVHVRSWFLSLAQMEDDGSSVLSSIGTGIRNTVLYSLRFAMDRRGTARGVRQLVLNATPLPDVPARVQGRTPPALAAGPKARKSPGTKRTAQRRPGKQAAFLELVTKRHGELPSIEVGRTAAIATALAPEVALNAGQARKVLRAAVLAAQNGHGS